MTAGEQSLCIYCQKNVADTVDHVPPRCLFGKTPPKNLITVPCCSACNKGFSKDDEYFRTAMAFRWDVSDHPAVAGPLASALRSMEKKEASGLRRLFFGTLESAPIITHGGLYVEEGARFEADINRIYAVVRRIIRGLHYKKTGVPIPVDQGVMVLDDETAGQFAPVHRNEILRTLQPILQGEPEMFGEEAFLFFWDGEEGNLVASKWFLVFFSRIIFYGATAPKVSLKQEKIR